MIFSDHNETSNQLQGKTLEKTQTNGCNQWDNQETKEEIKNILRQIKWKHNNPKLLGHHKSNSKREMLASGSTSRTKKNFKQSKLICKKLKKEEQSPK